ncbi:MAG TPA: peptidylprolyl isomerase [Acholeplasmatales bacterium]|nr:peptidylprolyl isomerase [Acholeplasmatales bacterium]
MENQKPLVTITVKGYAPMTFELEPAAAPNTVKNFIDLAQTNYFIGAIFHRVIPQFMIQGGAGSGKARSIKGEFKQNGVKNDLLHERGVLSMARTMVPDSASSQFFVMHQASPHLDGAYAAFGRMIAGFETLDAIAGVATDRQDKPLKDVTIDSVKVDTFGIDYGKPVYAGR